MLFIGYIEEKIDQKRKQKQEEKFESSSKNVLRRRYSINLRIFFIVFVLLNLVLVFARNSFFLWLHNDSLFLQFLHTNLGDNCRFLIKQFLPAEILRMVPC